MVIRIIKCLSSILVVHMIASGLQKKAVAWQKQVCALFASKKHSATLCGLHGSLLIAITLHVVHKLIFWSQGMSGMCYALCTASSELQVYTCGMCLLSSGCYREA